MSFTKRRSGSFRRSLPHFSPSAVQEKYHGRTYPWFVPFVLGVPGLRTRRLRLWLPNPRRIHQFSVSRFGRKRGFAFMALVFAAMVFAMFALAKRFGTEEKTWPAFTGDPPTLVFRREDLQRIWTWEVASGHYPSRRRIPEQLGLKSIIDNPSLPPRRTSLPSRFRAPAGPSITTTHGIGPRRVYLDIQSQPPNVAYPPRPVPGSVADLDIVMEHCDFSEKKYVRDCLEVLRLGGGLDNGKRLRRGKMDDWKYIYLEQLDAGNETASSDANDETPGLITGIARDATDPDNGLTKKRGVDWEVPPMALPQPVQYRPYQSLSSPCDPETPRIFHMFWTGPFTDKPYLALLSFLFTQNTGLHLHDYPTDNAACRPKFWLWINPGPAAAVPNPSAMRDMFAQLKSTPWASPFLHPRFKDVIQFKLWNTTEQLDGVPELRDEWRTRESLFNSGGHVISVPPKKADDAISVSAGGENATETSKADEDDMLNRTGSKSSTSYDRLSVILSDMARFILCHRFGGIYLDADTLLLRDWEELWGWKGAFAYRWSRLEKYNTAVLHLNKGSALGTFLFRTALKNDLDFHPMTVSRYLKEAHLEGLLLRLPDALFDSAWLNTEYFQLSRPPQPFFTDFQDFFDTPLKTSAAPHALGFDGFFKGAFSYHFHNYWWKPFDPARNWPDLGARFIAGERTARASVRAAATSSVAGEETAETEEGEDKVEDDQRDLDWSTVLKRTFESYVRGERPNMYGEWIEW
ncbi:glycosyltransferase family 32 protein [Mycena albidolilacea]|uniref:Glycosyltransferase family 32 protein n=1 Tax=Mycena albidolilacea TaxID=1033008 RepID=A0AAD7EZH7_9AGAR|nr:glycosyltransferase family 32 protein [Mycena albidolilacea]